MKSACLITFGLLSLVCSARAGVLFCLNPDALSDVLGTTHEAAEIMAGYTGRPMKMIAWDSHSDEKTNTCYVLSFDDTAKTFTIDYKTEAGVPSQVTGTYTYFKEFPAGLEVQRTSENGASILSLPANIDDKTSWYITHISRADFAFQTCTGGFFTQDREYIFSHADLATLTDECVVTTIKEQLDADVERTDLSKC